WVNLIRLKPRCLEILFTTLHMFHMLFTPVFLAMTPFQYSLLQTCCNVSKLQSGVYNCEDDFCVVKKILRVKDQLHVSGSALMIIQVFHASNKKYLGSWKRAINGYLNKPSILLYVKSNKEAEKSRRGNALRLADNSGDPDKNQHQ
ncbi:hypothetical protein L9F63_011831, partial [Diploptera punctata]